MLSEIIELFPSHYIHVGGDECPRDRWQQCPKCQALIHNNGWKDTKEHKAEDKLQSYFMTEVERFVNSKGRQIIGWDEILEGGLAPNATVMSWRGTENGIKAAEMQHDVIMTPAGITYFSGRQLLELGGFAVSMISKSVRIHYRKLPPSISSVYRPVYGRSELIPRNGLST